MSRPSPHRSPRLPLLMLLALLSACAGQSADPMALRDGPPGLNVADAALDTGSPEAALNIARGLLARTPDDAGALTRQGEALAQLGRIREAEESFAKALKIAPKSIDANLGIARIELTRGEAAKAEAALDNVLDRDPHNVKALVNVGIARDLQGHHDDAQAAYRDALSFSPGLMAARVNLGLSLALAGKGDEATEALRPLAQMPDAPPSVRHNLAVALAVAGHTNEAERAMGTDLPASEIHTAVALYRTLKDPEQ